MHARGALELVIVGHALYWRFSRAATLRPRHGHDGTDGSSSSSTHMLTDGIFSAAV